jgi:alkaline phosphatase
VLSSVSLNHATPAAYYASIDSRNYYNNIATQLANTGYEFFGGGGLVAPTEAARAGDTSNNVWELLEANGYEVLNTKTEILALKDEPRDKVVCINPTLPTSSAMPYAIDKPEENVSLAEMTEVAIANLYVESKKWNKRNRKWKYGKGHHDRGFFIMVEGGKIDWACHANDAVATFGDMIDFDNAIGVALNFFNEHPHETLIVVTGDHETGGMTIGHATTGYKAYYEKLIDQVASFEDFQLNYWPDYKASWTAAGSCASVSLAEDTAMHTLMENVFGLRWEELNRFQKEKLETAYAQSLCGIFDDDEKSLLYAGYEPIIVTITQILNENASIGWTSYMHTGTPVPIFAQGYEAWRFAGFYDNTDIAKKLAVAMDFGSLPVER